MSSRAKSRRKAHTGEVYSQPNLGSPAGVSILLWSPVGKTWYWFQLQANVHVTKVFMLWFPHPQGGIEADQYF